MEAQGRRLFFCLLLLAFACAAVLALDTGTRPERPAAQAFHKQTGGLGFGTSFDLDGCASGFDPRLEGGCGAEVGPLPGAGCFCPRHGGALSYPRQRGLAPTQRDGDAIPP